MVGKWKSRTAGVLFEFMSRSASEVEAKDYVFGWVQLSYTLAFGMEAVPGLTVELRHKAY